MYECASPGGTLSGEFGWKNFVWWFFCAIMTVNLGFHFSSRNLQAWGKYKISWELDLLYCLHKENQGTIILNVFKKVDEEPTSIIWLSSIFRTWLNWDSLTPSLESSCKANNFRINKRNRTTRSFQNSMWTLLQKNVLCTCASSLI